MTNELLKKTGDSGWGSLASPEQNADSDPETVGDDLEPSDIEASQESGKDKEAKLKEIDLGARAIRAKDHDTYKDLMDKLPPDAQEFIFLFKDSVSTTRKCPSTGRKFTKGEAAVLYRGYAARVAEMNPDDVPSTERGVLLEIENMLEEKIEAANAAGKKSVARIHERSLAMITDLESMASVDEYCEIMEATKDRGSSVLMRGDIEKLLRAEGYRGALRLEKDIKIIDKINFGDEADSGEPSGERSIEDVARDVLALLRESEEQEQDTSEKKADLLEEMTDDAWSEKLDEADWAFIKMYSKRGTELFNLIHGCVEAKKQEQKRERLLVEAENHKRTQQWLRTKTPRDSLPSVIKEKLANFKLTNLEIAASIYRAAQAIYVDIWKLKRKDEPLPSRLQKQVDASGQSRDEYASTLDERREGVLKKVDAAVNGDIPEDLRESITRKELASSERESQHNAEEEAKHCDKTREAIIYTLKRSPKDFAREVLCEGRYWAPELPDGVADYLFAKYGKDIDALNVGKDDPQSEKFHVNRLIKLRQCVRRDAVAYLDYHQDAMIARTQNYYEVGWDGSDPSGGVGGESRFARHAVLPYIDQLITTLGGKIPYDKAELAEQAAAAEKEREAQAAVAGEQAPRRSSWIQRFITDMKRRIITANGEGAA